MADERPQRIRAFIRLVVWSYLLLGLFLYFKQDVLIFPGYVLSEFQEKGVRKSASLPKGVESKFLQTADDESIELWRLDADRNEDSPKQIAIIFHGNGDTVDRFFSVQQWFQAQGVTSYSFDYRGFGNSTGQPSEQGLYNDSDAIWNEVVSREKVDPQQVVILGYSVGAALAAQLAAKHQVGALILLAPFASMRETIKKRSVVYSLYLFLLKYNLPTAKYVSELKYTNLIVAHGRLDEVVPFTEGQQVFASYQGGGERLFIDSPDAGHGDVFAKTYGKLSETLKSWSSSRPK